MMLAFYLAVPEVENDRRGLNVKNGMLKAKQEERWLGPASLGYKNQYSTDKIKLIIPVEPEATIIKYAFEQLAKGVFTVSEIYQETVHLGLNCSRSNFWNLIRNPVYAGNIRIMDQNNQTQVIPVQYIGIVSSSLFSKVQDLAFRNKNNKLTKPSARDQFFLKGFIHCPKCYKQLMASSSTGRTKKYDYYHCISSCGFRLRADMVNSRFYETLSKMSALDYFKQHYKQLIQENVNLKKEMNNSKCSQSIKSIKKLEERLFKCMPPGS